MRRAEAAPAELAVRWRTGLPATLALVALLGAGAAIARFAQVYTEATGHEVVLWQTHEQLELERAQRRAAGLRLASSSAALFGAPALLSAALLLALRASWRRRRPGAGGVRAPRPPE